MTDTTRGILVLEGGDAAGKTTLAHAIVERYGGIYLHGTVTPDAFAHHLDLARRAIAAGQRGLAVVDRHWLSEQVYGPIVRGAAHYNEGARCFDRLWRKHAAVYVLASPRDVERQLDRWRRDRAAGKEEYPGDRQVRDVLRVYADLRDGNVAHPGDLYFDQLVRWGDFTTRDDVVTYDLDVDGEQLHEFIDRLVEETLSRHRAAQLPAALDARRVNLAGHAGGARFLLVGEAASPTTPYPRWPFFDDDRHLSAATWLNRSLHRLAIDETKLVITNARTAGRATGQFLVELHHRRPDLRVVALGRLAERAARAVEFDAVRYVPHPGWARRSQSDEYVEQLREALRS